MKSKQYILLITASILSIGVVATAIKPMEKIVELTANDVYSCNLPVGFVEIDEVIGTALTAGETKTNNILSFRGTVTRRVGDIAYVQRVNQTDHVSYGLRISGVNEFAPTLQAGNVVDFNGGQVYTFQGIPSFELTSVLDAEVKYSVNTMGYEPITYQSLNDLDQMLQTSYYDKNDDVQTLSYASNRLVRVNNLLPNHYYGVQSYDDEGRELATLGNNSLADGVLEVYVPAGNEFENIYNNAVTNGKMLNVTGYYQVFAKEVNSKFYCFNAFTVVDIDDIEIGNDHFDYETITNVKTSNYIYWIDSGRNKNYVYPFTIYNIAGHNDVPYVEIMDFYNSACLLSLFNGRSFTKVDGTNHRYWYYYQNNSYAFEFQVDANEDWIVLDYDPSSMAFEERDLVSDLELICQPVDNYVTVDTSSSRILGDKQLYGFDLARYGIDIVEDKNNIVYVPLQIMNSIFNDLTCYPSLFNGKDLYYSGFIGHSECNYYTDSPWTDENWDGTVSNEYAEYNYQCLCFSLEEVYGLAKDRGIVYSADPTISADSLLTDLGYKTRLMSTVVSEQEEALMEFAGSWLADGHTSLTRSAVPFDSNEMNTKFWTAARKNERIVGLSTASNTNSERREAAGKGVGLSVYNDTAIITFDAFVKYRESYVKNDVTYEADAKDLDLNSFSWAELHEMGSDLLFKKAFDQITANPAIKNVVIDLTVNGGGENDSLPVLEAYMTDDPIHTCYNRLTNLTYEVHYDVDLDYDGVFGDTYKDDYNFYVMTSSFSFSCGNYFPTVCKEKGMATLIGQRSGGGTCPVCSLTTSYGTIFRSSGKYQLGTWATDHFENNDSGVPVDYEFSPDYFYDDEAIYNFIHSL